MQCVHFLLICFGVVILLFLFQLCSLNSDGLGISMSKYFKSPIKKGIGDNVVFLFAWLRYKFFHVLSEFLITYDCLFKCPFLNKIIFCVQGMVFFRIFFGLYWTYSLHRFHWGTYPEAHLGCSGLPCAGDAPHASRPSYPQSAVHLWTTANQFEPWQQPRHRWQGGPLCLVFLSLFAKGREPRKMGVIMV
jgi:hypothetical protein